MRGIERAEKVSRIFDTGITAIRGLLALGQALPGIGDVCRVAEQVLAEVQRLNGKLDDILQAGQLVVDVLELLRLMSDNVHQLSTGRGAVEQRMQRLHKRLTLVRDAVKTFGKKGWIKRVCKLMIDQKSLSNIDAEVRDDLTILMHFYKVARDAHVTEMLAQHTYASEVAIDEQAQRHVDEVGGSKNEAIAWVQDNDRALNTVSEQIGVGIDELKEGVGAMREEMGMRFDQLRDLLVADGSNQYQYDPFDPDDIYHENAELGRGTFGVTYRMVSLYDEHKYAVKIIQVRRAGVSLEQLSKEASILRQLNHPHIVRYFTSCTFERGHEFAIVMELLTGGTFGDGVRRGAPPARVKVWVGQVASGLACMHARRILHRDLKPENVMFDEAGSPRIIDLGLSCTLASKSRLSTRHAGAVGSNLYMSPEKAEGQSYNEKDDVWALGCMLAGGILGKLLEDMSDINSQGCVCRDRAKMDSLVKQSGAGDASVSTLVARMLRQTPLDRPTAQQVEQALLQTGHAVAGEAVASTSSAPALGVAVLSSIPDPVVVQGIPIQPAPAVVSGAASRPARTEPLVSEQGVSTFLQKVGGDLSALRDKTSIEWNNNRINDHDCVVIAHLALPASSQSPSMGVLGKLTHLRQAPPAPPSPE